jgi:hypothetical protein
MIILFIILFIVILSVGIFFVTKNKSSTTSKSNTMTIPQNKNASIGSNAIILGTTSNSSTQTSTETSANKEDSTDARRRVCGQSLIPPCGYGYDSKNVKDPLNKETTYKCCLIDPYRNDPELEEILTEVGIFFAQQMAIGIGLYKIGALIDNILKEGLSKTGTKIISSTTSIFAKKIAAKVATEVASETAQKVVTTLSIKMLAKSVASSVMKSFAYLMMGPVGWAIFAVDMMSMGLDLADPGGYADVTLLKEYRKNRNKTNEIYDNMLKKEGIIPPLIQGPDSKFPDKILADCNIDNILNEYNKIPEFDFENMEHLKIIKTAYQLQVIIILEYNKNMTLIHILDVIKNAYPRRLTTNELTIEINKVSDLLDKYLSSPEGTKDFSELFTKTLCKIADGIIITPTDPKGQLMCSYKDRKSCDESYDWNKIKYSLANPKDTKYENNNDTTYVEWRDNKCIIVSPILRHSCADSNLDYNYDNQLCKITKEYCRMKGMEPKDTVDGIDCEISDGQNVAELIFGTTVTRGLIQVFDPKQYEPCKKGEFDFAKLSIVERSILYTIPFVVLYGDKLCFIKNTKCMKGLEMEDSLCYSKCKDGYKSDRSTMCYKQYPEFENNNQKHTLTSITKNTYSNSQPLNSCASNKEKSGALCYNKCRDGYSRSGQTCTENGSPYIVKPSPLKFGKTKCDNNKKKVGALCYDKCKGDYDNILGVCTPHKYTDLKDPGEPMTCGEGQTKKGALCYDKCKDGYKEKTLGLCAQKCPDDSTDFGVGCTRKSYSRGAGIVPLGMYLKHRRVPYGKSDGPSPAELLYGLTKDSINGNKKKSNNTPEITPTPPPDICDNYVAPKK